MKKHILGSVVASCLLASVSGKDAAELIGHWKLRGDCRDLSGHGHHGINHGVKIETGEFDGVHGWIEVPAGPALQLGTKPFSISAWVYTERDLDDVLGDIIDLYDPARRRGFTLSMYSSGSGYQGQGDDRQVLFGIDNARLSDWEDCGRPSLTSQYVSNSMLVYKGHLYAAITDAKNSNDWSHVFRFEGGKRWTDCGRVGTGRTAGVGPLVVHQGELYGVTWTYDWTRVKTGGYDPGRVYRYTGGTNWVDCGQPSANRTLNTSASYRGQLYTGGGPEAWGVYVQKRDGVWQPSHLFPMDGPARCFPHAMCRFNGELFTAYPGVYRFDGGDWRFAGTPGPLNSNPSLQTHSFAVYQGRLCAGTWPEAKVAYYLGGDQWQEIGRVGVDGTEVNALTVYNGQLYGGSIPRAEVCRYDGEGRWTSLKRFYSPEGWSPGLPGRANRRQVTEWSRITSLAINRGRLLAGIGSCTSAVVDRAPDPGDVLGKVFAMEAGKCVSSDEDLGAGWRHIAAIRESGKLRLYIDGKLVAESAAFNPADLDLSVEKPLRIGVGQTDYFKGRIADVRLYSGALSGEEARAIFSEHSH